MPDLWIHFVIWDTLITAKTLGRNYLGIELDPHSLCHCYKETGCVNHSWWRGLQSSVIRSLFRKNRLPRFMQPKFYPAYPLLSFPSIRIPQ